MPLTLLDPTQLKTGSSTVNVLSVGAKGDGVTDDSSAINAGLAVLLAVGGGTLYFPGQEGAVPTAYMISAASITIPCDRITLRGDGYNNSIIKLKTAATTQVMAVTGAYVDTTIVDLGFDGNFINQTHPAATLNTAINGTGSTRLRILNCKFRAFGYTNAADSSYAQVISLYNALDCEVSSCLFLSNFAYEILLNGTQTAKITGNTFGSQNLTDAQTHINWWDTHSGGFGTLCVGSSNIYFANNRTFGVSCTDAIATGYMISSGGAYAQNYNIQIHNNVFQGLGNSRGTVSVTNGSGVITGSNTFFAAGHVNRRFKVEGDATEYTITAYSSATSITVSPTIARSTLSGLRYQYQNSGDAIAVYSVLGLQITGNAVYDSGDMAYDIAAPAGQNTQHVVFANNIASRAQVAGLYMGGALFDVLVTGNMFNNNNRKQLADHQGAIEMSPTDQSGSPAQNMWHITFVGNQFTDDQAAATQLYAFQIEAGQSASIFSNTLANNPWIAYAGGGALFDPSTTPAMQGTMFNYPGVSSLFQLTPVTFAGLASIVTPANGTILYCSDARSIADGAAAGSVAAGAGTGAIVKRQNGAWVI